MSDQRDPASERQASVDLREALAMHGDRLLRSAFLLCGDETEAQDLVQETFLEALRAGDRFRGASAVYTWLYGILRNVCHRHARKQRRMIYKEEPEDVPQQPNKSDAGDDAFCSAKLTEALWKLSPEHREAVVLRYYENLKIDQIAEQTGVSKGTIKSRLHYATRYLEQLLPAELNLFAPEDTHKRVRS